MDIYYHEYGNILKYLYEMPPKPCTLIGKTILGHKTNDFGYKNIVKKIKYFTYMSNSMIFGGHF